MRKKRRNGRVTTETCVEDEIVHLLLFRRACNNVITASALTP